MADTQTPQKGQGEQKSSAKDENALPTPQEKYDNAEADRKRLAEEHGNA